MKKKERLKINFRLATIADVEGLAILEKDVWGAGAANREQLASRISIFPQGNIIAVLGDTIVAYVAFEYVDDIINHPNFTWAEITGNGMIASSHRPEGEYLYGINLSVHHSMRGRHLSLDLFLHVWANIILNNKRGTFLGSRIPYFRSYKKRNPEASAEEYVKLKRNGHAYDPELRLYEKDGLKPVKILPGYFPDPPSLDYGVLVYRNNPFYNWPFRKAWAYMIGKIPSIRDKFIIKER
jgi:hypothetical protein